MVRPGAVQEALDEPDDRGLEPVAGEPVEVKGHLGIEQPLGEGGCW